MKRTTMRRKARLKARRTYRIDDNDDKSSRRKPAGYDDPEYIAWLEWQPCRVTGNPGPNVAHHLRHTETGAAMGKNLKDDRRAITLSVDVHIPQLHGNAGYFKGWTKAQLRAWENEQLAIQRSEYEAHRKDRT